MRIIAALLLTLGLTCNALADFQIIATVSLTNGTVNGETITANGDTRTWTNSVNLPASLILTNSAANGAAANLFAHLAVTPFSGITLGATSTTNVTLKAGTNVILTVTVSSGWAVVSYSTNTVGVQVPVLVPLSGYLNPAQRTNVASGVAAMVNDPANTNGINGAKIYGLTLAKISDAGSIASSNATDYVVSPTNSPSDGQVVSRTGDKNKWVAAGGTVTSVDASVPAEFSISGNPITSSGTLAISKANETANTVWSGPTSGGAAAPTFRSLVALDIPSLTVAKLSDAGTAAYSNGTAFVIAPTNTATDGQVVSKTGDKNKWIDPAGGGTVTSVGLTMPAEFSVASSPVTASGTIAVTKANENANLVFAGPTSGGAGAPTFRSLVVADAPQEVSSVCIPMGAWFTNNVFDGLTLTPASAISVTNTSDGFAFTDAITNCIRSRFALPWDWNAGTVQVEIQALSTGTNSGPGGATNVVFAVRAAASAVNDSAQQPTFGTAVWTTNHFGIGAYTNYTAITTALTVGNTPAAGKSILWEIQRLGAQAGDTETNVNMCVTEVKVYYTRTPTATYPTATP